MLGLFFPLYVYFILLLLIVSCGIDIIVVKSKEFNHPSQGSST